MRKRATFNSRAVTPDSAPTTRDIDFVRSLGKGRRINIGQLRIAQIVEARGLAVGRDDGTWRPTKKGLALLAGPAPAPAKTRKPSEFGHMFIGTMRITADGKTVTTTEVEKHLENGVWVDGPPPARKSTQRKGRR